ncbi:hypothetical protein C8J56DRAFT_1168263 [Mycena floridula]|nr:hypothetical protein C8J56DRAFT_1168263 [Mycena floridula]
MLFSTVSLVLLLIGASVNAAPIHPNGDVSLYARGAAPSKPTACPADAAATLKLAKIQSLSGNALFWTKAPLSFVQDFRKRNGKKILEDVFADTIKSELIKLCGSTIAFERMSEAMALATSGEAWVLYRPLDDTSPKTTLGPGNLPSFWEKEYAVIQKQKKVTSLVRITLEGTAGQFTEKERMQIFPSVKKLSTKK